MTITGKFLTSETLQGEMDIYVVGPASKEQFPVIIVLQEAFGVNSHIRSVCDRLAKEGFFVAAPDLYHRSGRRIEIDYADRKEFMPLLGQLTNQQILQDVRATINFLDDLPGANTQNVSTVGFCVGGFASVLCATKLRLEKMVSFYGGGMVHPREGMALSPIVSDMPGIKSKCLFFFGGQDASISPDDIVAIEQKLTSSKVKFEAVIYQNSDHGFFCDERKSYDPESAENAWMEMVSFLKTESSPGVTPGKKN